MKVIIIGNHQAVFWRKVVRATIPNADVTIYDENYDGDFTYYDLSIIAVNNTILVEDSIKDGVPTISAVFPSKSAEEMNSLYEIVDLTGTPYLCVPSVTFSDIAYYLIEATEIISPVKHISFRYVDNTVKDIVWDLGVEVSAFLIDLLPKGAELGGVGVYGDGNPAARPWANTTLFCTNFPELSINLHLSTYGPEKTKEIIVVGEHGSLVCRPDQKEIMVKDNQGRYRTKLGSSVHCNEEQMLRFFIEKMPDNEVLNAESPLITTEILNGLESAFVAAQEEFRNEMCP